MVSVLPPTSWANADAWSRRLRWLWMTRRHPDPACVLDGLTLHHKWPVADLGEAARSDCGAVLLVDHGNPDAMETLLTVRTTHRHLFDAGSIVVGIENLPSEQADALVCYRRAAQVPVFAVDLARRGDRLLLQEALIATRVAAALYRDAGRAVRVPPAGG